MINTILQRNVRYMWYGTIIWWELIRILYNIIMAIIGFLSFYIAFFTVPIFYIFIDIILNLLFTIGWISELLDHRNSSRQERNTFRKKFLIWYFVASVIVVLAIPIWAVS